jgi:endonuclease/exonuclease/phosphatase family metal-dependent hydrolase
VGAGGRRVAITFRVMTWNVENLFSPSSASRLQITTPRASSPSSPLLGPVQSDDQGGTEAVMGRGSVAVTFDADSGTPVRLVTTHLKTRPLTFPGGRYQLRGEDERARFAAYVLYRRAAEAAMLRVWVDGALDAQSERRPLVLAGDLNDTVEVATAQLLLGPPGSEFDAAGFGKPDKGDRQRLRNRTRPRSCPPVRTTLGSTWIATS